ncbi:hypothetical protein QBC36DRAFT_323091 [Triangularia setosa]|uniref:rRNA-processing protein FYV7 n=1 Tax=Triangularia setosa TaxID=2587417 RepID=A0AAN6WCA9_9PEZI|nr:hypothetical protein QBC36DRAFT_323091 [Podospora setosa]
MAPKFPNEDGEAAAKTTKKPRQGFRVGPDNLPDGAWKRKVTKIKKDLITKAKIKKQYSKIRAAHASEQLTTPAIPELPPSPIIHPITTTPSEPVQQESEPKERKPETEPELHPDRLHLLTSDEPSNPNATAPDFPPLPKRNNGDRSRHKKRKPDYYEKELAKATELKAKQEARNAAFARRQKEREDRIKQRERWRKQMDKAKRPGKDGKLKVGRESKILLEKVERLVGGEK